MKEYAILFDSTYCTGCNTCMYKCLQENLLQEPASRGLLRTWVQINDHGLYHHRCMHCLEPACVEACQEANGEKHALTRSDYGPVLFDASLCIGCGACEDACPFGVPQIDAKNNKMIKCSMCAHRIQDGRVPACVEACPTSAFEFGEYRDIVAKATERAAAQKLKIYGLKENGGGRFLVLAPDPIQAGYPKVALSPVKAVQAAGLDVKTPALVALAIGGLKKFSDRRQRVEAEK